MRRYGAVCCFVRIIRFVKSMGFSISFQLLNNTVCIFRVVFSYKCFDAGRIKNGHIGFFRINSLSDWFSNINKVIKYHLKIFEEILFETSDLRSIRKLGETAEVTKRF